MPLDTTGQVKTGSRGRTLFLQALVLVAVAIAGGAVALGGASAFGQLGTQKTVREIVSPTASAPVAFAAGKAMSINEIYNRWASGVVQITSTSVVNVQQDPFFGNPFASPTQTQESLGSGFVIDKAGHIVTNYHVIAGAKTVNVSFSNGDNVKARIVGTDPSTDIAVLQVSTHSGALTPLVWGNSDMAQVGDSVVAIGNPFGYTRSVTAGIISAIDRPLTAPNNFPIEHAIQTDAALNHGNSGGPLLDARGEVIGVNSQISTGNTGQQGNLGIGFAVPSNAVRTVVSQIIQSGHAVHAFLGIRAQGLTPSIAQLFRLPVKHGLLVAHVEAGTAAAHAGLKGATNQVVVAGESWPLGGDIIVEADGVATSTVNALSDVIANHKPGDTIQLVVYRANAKQTIEVKLGRQPSSP
jgi:S1-C subfamily serine protease